MTPSVAARRVGPTALFVQRPKSSVVHVAAASPVGRSRARRPKPICAQAGKRWTQTETPSRRLCLRCDLHVRSTTDPVDLTAQELAEMADTVGTLPELEQVANQVVMAGLVTARIDGRFLTDHVSAGRHRLQRRADRRAS